MHAGGHEGLGWDGMGEGASRTAVGAVGIVRTVGSAGGEGEAGLSSAREATRVEAGMVLHRGGEEEDE